MCHRLWVQDFNLQKSTFCYYRPQTKFAKVMFSQLSVCPRGGGGALSRRVSLSSVSLSKEVSVRGGWGFCQGGSLSRTVSVKRGLCLEGLSPGGESLSRGSLSRDLCLGGGSVRETLYLVWLHAGVTHATAMHACLFVKPVNLPPLV